LYRTGIGVYMRFKLGHGSGESKKSFHHLFWNYLMFLLDPTQDHRLIPVYI